MNCYKTHKETCKENKKKDENNETNSTIAKVEEQTETKSNLCELTSVGTSLNQTDRQNADLIAKTNLTLHEGLELRDIAVDVVPQEKLKLLGKLMRI